MARAEGRFVITANGEIYNYKSLKQELEALGHRFISDSDTEVILAAYQEWGPGCLEKLEGMFAFAIWDQKDKVLFLVRDRFGMKPLYYSAGASFFIFASEIRALLTTGLIRPEVNPDALASFLSLGYIPPPHTFYKNIMALKPGHFMKISREGTEHKCYYNLRHIFQGKPFSGSYEEAVDQTRAALLQSVRRHLVADVEVGAFLSGGIDSSSLVSLMRASGQEKIKTVSAVFPGTAYDESAAAKKNAKIFGTEHHEIKIQAKDFFGGLKHFFSSMDQPTVDGVNIYFVSLAAKQLGLKTILSGVGGDEAFGGYPSFGDVPKLFKQLKEFQVLPARAYFIYRGLSTLSKIREILSPELSELVTTEWSLDSWMDGSVEGFGDDFSKVSFLETQFYMTGQLLRDTDVFSMAHALEVRLPFVHHPLLEWLGTVPARHKMGAFPKKLLADAVRNLPEENLGRPKKTFTFPLDAWLKQRPEFIFDENLETARCFNPKAVKAMRSGFLKGQVHWSLVWSLFVLNQFLTKSSAHQ